MFNYNICNEPDKKIFLSQCEAIEKHIPDIVKGKHLTDVDSSETQIYFVNSKKIAVHNSYYVGAVYIDSEIDIDKFFNHN